MTASQSPISKRSLVAFTRLELATVVVLLTILAFMAVPVLRVVKVRSAQKQCVKNLRQIGLALRIWMVEGNAKSPWESGLYEGGGSKGLLRAPWNPVPHWLVLSNNLGVPQVLVCPADYSRQAQLAFSALTTSNTSYFLGLDTSEEQPYAIAAGDRNLTWNGTELQPGLAVLTTNGTVGFGPGIHRGRGNLLLGDGSVNPALGPAIHGVFSNALASAPTNTMRLLVP